MAQSLSPHTHLPALRDDLRFLGRTQGSGGETVWLIFDPLRNRYLELRPVVYEVLSRWQTGTIGALMADIRADTAYQLDIQDIGTLIAYLRQHQLLRRSSSPQPSATPGWAANAHKYLSAIVFFRLRLLRPDRWLEIAGDAISPIFSTWFWIAVALAGGAGMLLVARQWDSFLGTFVGFLDIQGVAVLMVAIVISKIVHELGHAFSAKHYGCRIHAMGLAFILGMPLAYTDVSDTWRLKDRRQRLRVSAGGILAETLLAVVATWGWLILPDGSARAACFVLATTGWLGTLLINLNPFMRFDGYYLLSDALGIKNLQQRSFTLGLWALRRTLWGWPEPAPEKVTRRFLTFMVSFAWLTWVVRAMIFFGIAVLAYVMFGKTFGTLIAAVEIAIFIAAPIFKEVFVWIEKRKIWLKQKRAKRTLAFLGFVLLFAVIPQSFRLAMPAVLAPADRLVMRAPQPAVIASLPQSGEVVKADSIVMQLTDSQLQQDIGQSLKRLQVIELAMQQAAISRTAARQLNVFAQELAEEQARLDGLMSRLDQLSLRAPFDGRIVEVDPKLSVGMWINPNQPLFYLVSENDAVLTAYVNDRNRALVAVGSNATFYPEASAFPQLSGTVVNVQSVPIEFLEEPLLSSLNGGEIATREDDRNRSVPESGLYQVSITFKNIEREAYEDFRYVLRGRVYADSLPYSLGGYVYDRMRYLFSREAGH